MSGEVYLMQKKKKINPRLLPSWRRPTDRVEFPQGVRERH